MPKRGSLIVIEGTDGSGKQTQTSMLVERFNGEGIPTEHISFPRYDTPTGRIVGQCYLGKPDLGEGDVSWFGDADSVDPMIASLYYAADRMAAVPEIERILGSGTHLILDRYYQSNMAHQGGKIHGGDDRMKFFERMKLIELDALEIPKEDKVIFLYMPGVVSFHLRKIREEEQDGHESNIEHLTRAEIVYHDLVSHNDNSWEQIDCAPDGTINSLKTPEEISEEVYEIAIREINQQI